MPTRRRVLRFGTVAAVGGAGYLARSRGPAPSSDVSDVVDRLDPTWRPVSDGPWRVHWDVRVDGRPTAAAETAEGSVVVAGTRSEGETAPGWVREIDADGSVRTAARLPEDAPNGPPSAVLPTADGTLIGGDDGDDAAWIAALDEGGDGRWVRRYRPPGGSGRAPMALVPARSTDAAYTLVSSRESYDDWRDSAWLVRFDSRGRVRWNRTYDESASLVGGAYAPAPSTYLLAGGLDEAAGVGSAAGVLAIEAGGIAWRRTYPAEWFRDVGPAVDDDAVAVAVGHGDRNGRGDAGVVACLGDGGAVRWWRTLGSDAGSVVCTGVRATPSGYLVTGFVRREEGDDVRFFGTIDPDGSRCRCYALDRPRATGSLLAADRLLSVAETTDGAAIRLLGRV